MLPYPDPYQVFQQRRQCAQTSVNGSSEKKKRKKKVSRPTKQTYPKPYTYRKPMRPSSTFVAPASCFRAFSSATRLYSHWTRFRVQDLGWTTALEIFIMMSRAFSHTAFLLRIPAEIGSQSISSSLPEIMHHSKNPTFFLCPISLSNISLNKTHPPEALRAGQPASLHCRAFGALSHTKLLKKVVALESLSQALLINGYGSFPKQGDPNTTLDQRPLKRSLICSRISISRFLFPSGHDSRKQPVCFLAGNCFPRPEP